MIACDGCFAGASRWWHCLDCNVNLCAVCAAQTPVRSLLHEPGHLIVEYSSPRPWSRAEIREAVHECRRALDEKSRRQRGIDTFFDITLDNFLKIALTANGELTEEFSGKAPGSGRAAFFLDYLRRRKEGRFVDFFARKAAPGSDLAPQVLSMSQGTGEPLRWKGHSLYKTAFDLAIYQALFDEIRPRTLIEIGSGDGGSARWFSDLLRRLDIDAHVYSMDLNLPPAGYPGVTYLKGDCNEIEKVFGDYPLQTWPRPWVVVEDAHVNVTGVLGFLAQFLQAGDYLIVEDSIDKGNAIGKFLLPHRNVYRVDTRYTDLFGHNATCCIDSIFRRM